MALACPVCATGTGRQVRAGLRGGNLAATLVAVVLPFAIRLGIVAMIHFGRPLGAQRTEETLRDVR